MKHSKIFLRTLQAVTIVGIAAVVFMILIAFDVIPLSDLGLRGSGVSPQNEPVKVKRSSKISSSAVQDLLDQGDLAFFHGNVNAALAQYQKAATTAPRDFSPYEKIGDLSFEEKNYDDALKNFQLAVSLNASRANLPMKIVRTLLQQRKIPDAKAALEKIQPERQESLYYTGIVSAFLNDQEKAKEALTKSITLGGDEKMTTSAQKVLSVYRDFDLARESPGEYLQAMLANVFDQIGEYGLAIEISFEALKTKHDYRDVWIVLGHAFLNQRKWLDSDDAFSKAIDLDSTSATAFFFRAMARRNMQKNPTAIADLEQSLKLGWQPRIIAKQALADAYFDMQDFKRAFGFYKDVVLADSSDINRFVRPIALAINELKQPGEALTLAKNASQAHPDTAMGENLLGWAALANNDFALAHQHLDEALKRDPDLAAVYLNLGQLAEREKNIAEAISYYEAATKRAEVSGDESIGNTARVRYNELTKAADSAGTSTNSSTPGPGTSPQESSERSQNFIPSLSLQ